MKTTITMKSTLAACLLALGTMFTGLACSTTIESPAAPQPSTSTHTSTSEHSASYQQPVGGTVRTTRTTRSY